MKSWSNQSLKFDPWLASIGKKLYKSIKYCWLIKKGNTVCNFIFFWFKALLPVVHVVTSGYWGLHSKKITQLFHIKPLSQFSHILHSNIIKEIFFIKEEVHTLTMCVLYLLKKVERQYSDITCSDSFGYSGCWWCEQIGEFY